MVDDDRNAYIKPLADYGPNRGLISLILDLAGSLTTHAANRLGRLDTEALIAGSTALDQRLADDTYLEALAALAPLRREAIRLQLPADIHLLRPGATEAVRRLISAVSVAELVGANVMARRTETWTRVVGAMPGGIHAAMLRPPELALDPSATTAVRVLEHAPLPAPVPGARQRLTAYTRAAEGTVRQWPLDHLAAAILDVLTRRAVREQNPLILASWPDLVLSLADRH